MLMTVCAPNPMDVVRALCVCEGGIHPFNVDAAMRHLRMAGLARGGRILAVTIVAGETAYAFMYTERGAVISGADLWSPMICCGESPCVRLPRGMALVAEGLALIGADLDAPRTIKQRRDREVPGAEMDLFTAIEKCERRGNGCRRD